MKSPFEVIINNLTDTSPYSMPVIQEPVKQNHNENKGDETEKASKKIGDSLERLLKRNMKMEVTAYLQEQLSINDELSKHINNPKKDLLKCFRYINRMAYEYLKAEIENSDVRIPGEAYQGVYGDAIPADMVFQWAIDYFKTDGLPEDEDKPKPTGNTQNKTTTAGKSKSKRKKDSTTVANKQSQNTSETSDTQANKNDTPPNDKNEKSEEEDHTNEQLSLIL